MSDHFGELKIPPSASSDPSAQEIMRIWITGKTQQFIIKPDAWSDPAAWGLCLADMARHVSRAFAERGHDEKESFNRILLGFKIETEHPTTRSTLK